LLLLLSRHHGGRQVVDRATPNPFAAFRRIFTTTTTANELAVVKVVAVTIFPVVCAEVVRISRRDREREYERTTTTNDERPIEISSAAATNANPLAGR
jgi:hypothetical protein